MNLENKIIVVTGTVSNLDEIGAVLKENGADVKAFADKADCLAYVNNAEKIDDLIVIDMPLDKYKGCQCPADLWDEILKLYVRDNYDLSVAAAPKMTDGGNVVLAFASEAYVTDGDYVDAYTIAAGTERTMVNVLAQKLGSQGVAVKGIAVASAGDACDLHFPLGRGIDVELMGGTLAFLCSEDASYISGNTIMMDGGNHLAYRRYKIGK